MGGPAGWPRKAGDCRTRSSPAGTGTTAGTAAGSIVTAPGSEASRSEMSTVRAAVRSASSASAPRPDPPAAGGSSSWSMPARKRRVGAAWLGGASSWLRVVSRRRPPPTACHTASTARRRALQTWSKESRNRMREPTKASAPRMSPAPHGPASDRNGCPTAAPSTPPARRHPSRPWPILDAGRSRESSPAKPVPASPPPAASRPSSPSRWRSRATPKAAATTGTTTRPRPTAEPATNVRASPAAPATPSQMPSPPTPASNSSPTPAISRRWARRRPIGLGAPTTGRDWAPGRTAGLAAGRAALAGARRFVREATPQP